MRRIGMRTFAGLATIALSSLPVHADANSTDELKSACAGLAMPPWPAALATEPARREFGKTPEAAEGIASFREKRKPNWYPG